MGKEKANKTVEDFLTGKPEHTKLLFHHFVNEFQKLGAITLHPAKTMIGIANGKKRIAWITQFGKNFLHIVFPFRKAYTENLCFQKIAQVPGDAVQFNHHFRMLYIDDINEEITRFMKMAIDGD
jgi:hypothetical protein